MDGFLGRVQSRSLRFIAPFLELIPNEPADSVVGALTVGMLEEVSLFVVVERALDLIPYPFGKAIGDEVSVGEFDVPHVGFKLFLGPLFHVPNLNRPDVVVGFRPVRKTQKCRQVG